MRLATRLSSALGLFTLLLALHPAAGRANCPPVGANQVCYDQPAINGSFTNTGYTFPAGSHVRIQANGCEQTGGSGDTWKRYVNPDPWGNATQYHGLAGIYPIAAGGPATLPLTRISGIQGAYYRVTRASYLRVGFEDTDYDDNNYNDHDDGDGQCAWDTTGSPVPGKFYNADWGYSGPAYILLTVNPNAAPGVTASQPASYVSGVTSFSGTAGDSDGDALTYRFLVDGHDVSGEQHSASFAWDSSGAADGEHSLALEASDPYTSSTSDLRTFRVDNTRPTVTITSGPSNQTFGPDSALRWTFSPSDGPGSGIQAVQCWVDNAPVNCSSATSHSVSNLPGGTHTFSVQAIDKLGHGSTVDSRTFAIDATPPETTVTAGLDEGASTTDSTIAYTLASSEPGSSFRCRVYADRPAPVKPGFAPCSSGGAHIITGLAPAAYVFEADATDAYGNADPTPVVRHFIVASRAPEGAPPGAGAGGGSTGTGGGGSTGAGGGGGSTGPGAPAPAAIATPAIRATLAYAYTSPTRLKKLTLSHVPSGSTVRVTCRGRCPKALRRRYTKRHVSGSLSLTRLVRRGLKPGVRLSIVISKPGWRSQTKTLRIRRGRPPAVH
jgi:hypothetical protein